MPLVLFGCIGLFQFKGAGVKLIIGALLGNQLLVISPLNDSAVVQNHNGIGVPDGGQPVGDDEHGSARNGCCP